MSKALITSDFHLTSRPQDAYRWEVFAWLRKTIQRKGVSHVVIAGDLTDRKDKHDAQLVNRAVEELKLLSDHAGLFVLPGNHDYVDKALPYFRFLQQSKWCNYITEPTHLVIGASVWLLLPHERHPMKAWAKVDWKKLDLVVMHQSTIGASASNGQKMQEGLKLAYLRKRTSATIVSGDIHVPQQHGQFWYCGSPHPVHFGDEFEPRVLLYSVPNKVVSLPRLTIRKLVRELDSPDDVAAFFGSEEVREHDQLRLLVRVKRSELYQWPEIQARVRKLSDEKSVVLHAVEPTIVEAEAKGRKPLELRTTATHKTLREFATSQGLGEPAIKAGLDFLKDVGSFQDSRGGSGDYVPVDLEIQGFKVYGPKQRIDFNVASGLYFISGRNAVAPRLGSNSAGKSTIPDALSWVLFGRTLRGTFGPGVVNWSGEFPCVVAHTFRNAMGRHRIVRTQAPNTLTLQADGGQPKTVTEDEVIGVLGLSRDEFGFEALMGQFGRFFFDLKDTERLAIFSSALNLGVWELAADAAQRAEESAEASIKERHGTIEYLRGVRAECRNRRRELRAEKVPTAKELRVLRTKAKMLLSKARVLSEKCAEGRMGWPHEKRLHELDGESAHMRGRLSMLQGQLNKAQSANKRIKDKCPTCGAKLTKERMEAALLDGVEKVAIVQEDIRNGEKALKAFVKESDALLAKREAFFDKQPTTLELAELADRLDKTNKAHQAAETAARIGAQIAAKWNKDVALVKERLVEVDEKMSKAREGLSVMGELKAHASLWRNNFKQLRFTLVKEGQDELGAVMNSVMERLGLVGWSVTFDVERETAAKTLSRGFFVYVKAPGAPERVPWEAWCGGETQRLRLAGAMALGSFIASRTGVRSGLELWDEPTAH